MKPVNKKYIQKPETFQPLSEYEKIQELRFLQGVEETGDQFYDAGEKIYNQALENRDLSILKMAQELFTRQYFFIMRLNAGQEVSHG